MTSCAPPILGSFQEFGSFKTAVKTICGIEAMYMIRKEQVEEIQCALSEVEFFNKLMDVVA